MWKLRRGFCLISLLLLCSLAAVVDAQGRRRRWQTLNGSQPLVIARGGFSGLFADSSNYAYQLALLYALPSNYLVWCDVKPTRDRVGICFPNINLQNATNIDAVYPDRNQTYDVDGLGPKPIYFSGDFTLRELSVVSLVQGIYSRAPYFDGTPMPLVTIDDLITLNPPGLWLNIGNDAFFTQRNLSMRDLVISLSKDGYVNYISSPEVGFLQSIRRRVQPTTKLVFQLLEPDAVEVSTGQTYESLKNNLTFIKTFASGILVPKSYIWPVDLNFLSNSTSLVQDAHRSGLEVFASGFVNDVPLPYDYSYDPVNEYLNFIDNGNFAVDGVLSDFPSTASATVDCFSHMSPNDTITLRKSLLIFSSEGASGDYPGCTDKAYAKAVSDGVDILDCPVQVTSDGIPFCLGSINLNDRTNAAGTAFGTRLTTIPELQMKDGIPTYNLTWSEIQTLKPVISSPYGNSFNVFRNPRSGQDSHFLQLSEFLSVPNNASSVSGIIISIENATYLAENQGLAVSDLVLDALRNAGYENQTAKKVMIKSSESAVLKFFKSISNYELVYVVDESVRDILNDTISDIKEFASAVVISKRSVFPVRAALLGSETPVVAKLQAFNLSVYVQLFRNEFMSQAWDYFSDPYVELNTHINYMLVDGVIADYPATANRLRRNRCLGYKPIPNYMTPVKPGGLMPFASPSLLPPAEAPNPVLTASDVAEPPLPPPRSRTPTLETGNGSTAVPQTPSGEGQPRLATTLLFSLIAVLCSAVLFTV